MKKLKFIFFVLSFVIVSCLTISSTNANDNPPETLKSKASGLVCTVSDAETGQVIARCWFCNCGKFVTYVLNK